MLASVGSFLLAESFLDWLTDFCKYLQNDIIKIFTLKSIRIHWGFMPKYMKSRSD